LTRIGKILSHAALVGSREVTIAFNFISERSVFTYFNQTVGGGSMHGLAKSQEHASDACGVSFRAVKFSEVHKGGL
jgi:hypothetical protein